jgi:hypothetical protein
MLDVMSFCPSSDDERLEAYKKFFGLFGVSLDDECGTFKSAQNIFEEAHNNIMNQGVSNQ